MASSAFLNRAAETIFMAFVICCVLLTLEIRVLISLRFAMVDFSAASGGEHLVELFQRPAEQFLVFVVELLLLPDGLQNLGPAAVEELEELLLVGPELFD